MSGDDGLGSRAPEDDDEFAQWLAEQVGPGTAIRAFRLGKKEERQKFRDLLDDFQADMEDAIRDWGESRVNPVDEQKLHESLWDELDELRRGLSVIMENGDFCDRCGSKVEDGTCLCGLSVTEEFSEKSGGSNG